MEINGPGTCSGRAVRKQNWLGHMLRRNDERIALYKHYVIGRHEITERDI